MAQDHTYRLEELIFDLTEIQASDILAHTDLSAKDIYPVPGPLQASCSFPLDVRWNAILKHAVRNKRESDTDTLCLAADGIEWEYKGKPVISPLWLIPASYKINKIRQEIELTVDPLGAILNPFVRNELQRRYDLGYKEGETIDFSQRSIAFYDFLSQHAFPFEAKRFMAFGNFHHHRYLIVKDLEALQNTQLNPLVSEILGETTVQPAPARKLTAQCIVPADKDQQAVFKKAEAGNLVIQGPPGTGKSQVLTNLLSKLLDQGDMTLVVSEKKAALEVLVKKLGAHGLDAFAFIAHNQARPADFIDRLKQTWQLLERKAPRSPRNLLLSEQLIDQLQLKLDKLVSKQLIGGIGLSQFKKLVSGKDLSQISYSSDVPTVAEWLENKPSVEALGHALSFEALKHFRQSSLKEAETLDVKLKRLQSDLEDLSGQLDFTTFEMLETRIAQAARAQILENESYKKYARLFSSARERRKFEKLRSAFLQQQQAFEAIQPEKRSWKITPSLSMAQSWQAQLSESWWKKRKALRNIRKALISDSILPEIAVGNWLIYLEKEQQLHETVAALQQLGVERPETELESIRYLLQQLEKEDSNEINQVAALPAPLLKALTISASSLQQKYRELKNILRFDPSEQVSGTISHAIGHLPAILRNSKLLAELPPQLYRLLQGHAPEEAELRVLYSNRVQFESRFPDLVSFDGEALKHALQKIIDMQQEEQQQFGARLLSARHARFNAYHQLLRTPAHLLKPEEKQLKARLKAGKSLLVKEFAKTRQHKTIRELLDSEAREWIEILTPVWLSTPVQVATSFPMEKLFSRVIFDEASQIPLSHALGSLQRADSAIVAGDAQQMSPSSYFSGKVPGTDLLHQASYYWPRVSLKHHYRSMHPELIAFSNRFFYDDQLIAYPSADRQQQPLSLHYVPNAVYEGRQNIREAQAAAARIGELIDAPGSLGIVAFSEQQLDCTWKQLSPEIQEKLNARIDNHTAFLRALEQVQGDECDHLVVSLGYGKDPNGDFHLRFGPLSRANGSKRLNVLLSRAKNSIDFFHSIHAEEIPLSTNESVNLLRYFLGKEPPAQAQKPVFPFGLEPEVRGSTLFFADVAEHLPDAEELVILQSVLQQRGWEIRYGI